MRLRADLLDDAVLRDKLYGDLDAMQVLLHEGITYARDGQGVQESPCPVDLHTLLDSLVCDYVDAGKEVRLAGQCDRPMITRPHTLRRIITNLLDNALKFGRDPEIVVSAEPANHVSIAVRDRGPVSPKMSSTRCCKPFYRVESSRNRDTGGTGLGLAIAHQLAHALNGTLVLSNRSSGGLEARLSCPAERSPAVQGAARGPTRATHASGQPAESRQTAIGNTAETPQTPSDCASAARNNCDPAQNNTPPRGVSCAHQTVHKSAAAAQQNWPAGNRRWLETPPAASRAANSFRHAS